MAVQGDIGIQRCVLQPLRCLHRRIHLSADTQIRKRVKAGVSAAVVIPHCLEQTDHPLLDQILAVSAQDIHGFCFAAHQIFILITDVVHHLPVAFPQLVDELLICHIFILEMLCHSFPFAILFPDAASCYACSL